VQLEEGKDYLDRMQTPRADAALIMTLLTFSALSGLRSRSSVDLGVVTKEVLVDLEHRIERDRRPGGGW